MTQQNEPDSAQQRPQRGADSATGKIRKVSSGRRTGKDPDRDRIRKDMERRQTREERKAREQVREQTIREVQQVTRPPKSRRSRLADLVVMLVGFVLILTYLYANSRVVQYDIRPGMVSAVNISIQHDVRDISATREAARQAAINVGPVMVRSQSISGDAVDRVRSFFSIADKTRERLREETLSLQQAATSTETPETAAGDEPAPSESAETTEATSDAPVFYTESQLSQAAEALQASVYSAHGVEMDLDNARLLINLDDSIFDNLAGQTISMAEAIMEGPVDSESLAQAINDLTFELTSSLEFYQAEYSIAGTVLQTFLQANLIYDEEATVAAQESASQSVLDDPIMIPRGTQLVSVGDTITQDIYDELAELNMVDTGEIDWQQLLGLATLLLIVFSLGYFYMEYYERSKEHLKTGDKVMLVLTLLLPIILAPLLVRFSPLAIPVYFSAIIISTYFGLRTGVVMSLLLILTILPLTGMDVDYLFSAIVGTLTAANVASRYRKQDNQVSLLAYTSVSAALATFVVGVLQKVSWTDVGLNSLISLVTAGLSSVAAIGVMPLLEVFLSSVSPMRLIELAQPSNPLLRRLFLEAPGTNQHSMMVANLGEAAADAIGADAMLVRVGAYYHDVGKLDHPEMFTENQSGTNPHDLMDPTDSARIIIDHVASGLKRARQYRLPLPIQHMITEHHGNTLQASFFYKAKDLAEQEGTRPPDEADFRYPWKIPSSRESAILMLADSFEAAMRSTKTSNIEDADVLVRKIVKIKNEQDQLIDSGLSFAEVETIIRAFLQVYQGQFHERVRYPERASELHQTEQIIPSAEAGDAGADDQGSPDRGMADDDGGGPAEARGY